MDYKTEKKHQEDYAHLEALLKDTNRFVLSHPVLSFIDFDYYTVHDLTLFSVEPDFDYVCFERTIRRIDKTLPSMKRIFAKPIIALKDKSEVLPVETVYRINQETLSYLGTHTNLVSGVDENGVKPVKLLTQVYEDDYGIYENKIFADYVDACLKYGKKNLIAMQRLLYASETMKFNLLERVNHLDYFLALGKLHTGYIRDFTKHYGKAKELSRKTAFLLNTIKSRLKKPVYQKNKKRNEHLPLKKTNIFLMQKDYHEVYLAYRYLLDKTVQEESIRKEIDFASLRKNYFYFCEIMTLFSLSHFSFRSAPEQKINLLDIDTVFSFKGWDARLRNLGNNGLILAFSKDVEYSILLVPSIDYNPEEPFKENVDETIILTPFESKGYQENTAWVSVENIDSFRRLQQVFLKGMIHCDITRDTCPFCGEKLVFHPEGSSYHCENCRTTLKEEQCPKTGERYFVTGIEGFLPQEVKPEDYSEDDAWLFQRKVASMLAYRNITPIDGKGRSICPYCHKVHEE
ncbi:MAG: zinc ribbon domain-containing protein [Bacilli bacterium]